MSEPAFPSDRYGNQGMSLRDYFAAMAMNGEAAESGLPSVVFPSGFEGMAQRAYRMADAMLKEREKESEVTE